MNCNWLATSWTTSDDDVFLLPKEIVMNLSKMFIVNEFMNGLMPTQREELTQGELTSEIF
jgi:hypothetical protein